MQTRYLYLLRFILPIVDLLMLNAVYMLAFYTMEHLGRSAELEWQTHYLVVCSLLWLLSSFFFGLHTEYVARRLERIYRSTWKTVALHIVLFTLYLFFSKENN